MPLFVDTHLGSDLSAEAIRDFLAQAKDARRDQFGVLPLDLYCSDDGRVFYVLGAPDEAAVRRHHADQGVVCRQVRQVRGLPVSGGNTELSDDDRAQVRSMIVAAQTAMQGNPPGEAERRLRHVG